MSHPLLYPRHPAPCSAQGRHLLNSVERLGGVRALVQASPLERRAGVNWQAIPEIADYKTGFLSNLFERVSR